MNEQTTLAQHLGAKAVLTAIPMFHVVSSALCLCSTALQDVVDILSCAIQAPPTC